MSLDQLKSLLPKRDFWFSDELAKAFRVTRTTIQRSAALNNIGKMYRRDRGGRGIRVFTDADLPLLLQRIHPVIHSTDKG